MVRMLPRRHTLAAATMAMLWPAACGVVVRHGGSSDALANSSQIPTKAEITEKWDKMDEFLEIMFMLACKWKHGKDVHGAAVEKGKSSGMTAQQVLAFKKELRSKNVKQLTSACGAIVAKGKGKCRYSCSTRWGEVMAKRSQCDAKCVASYAAFETSCRSKAANLERVYSMKMKMAESRETCYEGHCSGIPQVWMKADAAAMNEEVGVQCANQCTAERIQTRCDSKFQLEVDFIRGAIERTCHNASTVTTCFEAEQANQSTVYDTCVSTDKGTCDTQYADCTTKGKTDSTFKQAKEFCEERKKMCNAQVDKHCLADHKAGLEEAKGKCESEAAAGEGTCQEEALAAKETELVDKCKTELPPKCIEDCKKSCQVPKMNQCLANLSGDDPAEAFCSDFWRLLHESSQVDPITGDPIVLLSRKNQ